MSLQRAIAPTTSSSIFFRALVVASTSRSCPHTLRRISSSANRAQSSKRELYTTPSYRPHSFPESFPPPPPNTRPSDISIPGPKPKTNEIRTPAFGGENASSQTVSSQETQTTRAPKTEAQTTAPPAATSKTSPSTSEAKPRRSKLRPRKAALTITPSAIEHLRELLSQPSPKMIRVGVKNRGCSGLAYHLEYVDKPAAFDEVVEQEGVKVLIDSKALFSIIGSEMDWHEDELNTKFIFRNPNIKEECGCGESFMV